MTLNKGVFPIITAVLMLTFWILFAVFLPMQEAYVNWVLDDDWTWINIIGFTGSLFGIFAINSIYSVLKKPGALEGLGYILAIIGIVILTSVLFFETFILKSIGSLAPELVNLDGSFYQNLLFKSINLLGGIGLTAGAIIISLKLLAEKVFKRWKVIMFMVACPLFGIVAMPGNVRLLGVLLYAISLIAIGVEMNRNPNTQRAE